MARKRRPPATARAPQPQTAPTPAFQTRPGRWIWFLLSVSAGLAIAAQLALIGAGRIIDQRNEATDVCLENTSRLRDALAQLPEPPTIVPVHECPARSDSALALIIIPFYIGIAGIAFALSQVVARRFAAWTYRRRLAKGSGGPRRT